MTPSRKRTLLTAGWIGFVLLLVIEAWRLIPGCSSPQDSPAPAPEAYAPAPPAAENTDAVTVATRHPGEQEIPKNPPEPYPGWNELLAEIDANGFSADADRMIRKAAADSPSVELLSERLDQGSHLERQIAMRILVAIGTPPAMEQVLSVLEQEEDLFATEELTRSFQSLDNPAAWPPLATHLLESQNHVVLSELQKALARIAPPECIQVLGDMLDQPLADWQRLNILTVLAAVRSEASVDVLHDLALATTNEQVLGAAAEALRTTGSPESVRALADLIVERDITNVDHPLVIALARIQSSQALPVLIERMESATHPAVKHAAARALAAVQAERDTEELDAVLTPPPDDLPPTLLAPPPAEDSPFAGP